VRRAATIVAVRKPWEWPLYSELGLVACALVESSLYPSGDRATTVLMALLGTVPLLFRRRLKLAATLITFATVFLIGNGASTPMTGAAIVSQAWIFLLLAERYRGVVAIALGTGLVLVVLSDGSPRASDVLLMAAGIGGLAVGHSRRLVSTAREDQGVLEERARIAREMHDVVAHHVSAIAIQADTGRLTRDVALFDAIGDTAREAMTEMRRVLGVLRDGEPERAPQPGLAQLGELLAAPGTRARLVIGGDARELSPGVELTAYRVVQEALTNARRHAPGASVEVALRYAPDALFVRVSDDGPGSGAEPGLGLTGMRERVHMVGGELTIDPSGGFVVEARLPA
jgi:signal transduction histidine kinase